MPVWRLQHRDTGRRDRQRVNRPTCRAKPTLHRRIVDRIFDLGRRFDARASARHQAAPARKLSRASSCRPLQSNRASFAIRRAAAFGLDVPVQSFGRVGEQISVRIASRVRRPSAVRPLTFVLCKRCARDFAVVMVGYGRRRNGNRCCRARRIFLRRPRCADGTISAATAERSTRPDVSRVIMPEC